MFVLLNACSGGGSGSPENSDDSIRAPETNAPSGVVTERTPPPSLAAPSPVVVPPVPTTPEANAPTSPDTQTPQRNDLLISEVSANLTRNGFEGTSWFELYNPTASDIQLSDYALRSSWRLFMKYYPGHGVPYSIVPIDFTLPAAVVPAGGYLVVAAKAKQFFADSPQLVHVGLHDRYPDWDTDGSIELLRNGVTVDFVRFRDSEVTPASSEHWSGPSVDYWPVKDLFNTMSGSYVRLASTAMQDTNTREDWTFVHYATPGGKNDMGPGESDADMDGIPDSAEIQGGSYAGVDFFAMGARAGRRDIFVELDYMVEAAPELSISSQPQEEALQKVVEAFARKNIAVHFDVGSAYSASFNPQKFNLGGGNPVPNAPCIQLDRYPELSTQPDCQSFYGYKSRFMDVRRRYVFHYGIFAPKAHETDVLAQAELFGNDMLFGLGGWSDGKNMSFSQFNQKVNLQAAVIMHELGHNLGLHHGGNDDIPFKPNHYSVMNPLYALLGLGTSPQSPSAADRYLFRRGGSAALTDICRLENSPCSTDFYIDYSDGTGEDIDESNVVESKNIGRGSVAGAYADWDGNGMLTSTPYSYHFNGNLLKPYPFTARILKDYNDWGNLVSVGGVNGRKTAWDMSWNSYSQASSFFYNVGLNE